MGRAVVAAGRTAMEPTGGPLVVGAGSRATDSELLFRAAAHAGGPHQTRVIGIGGAEHGRLAGMEHARRRSVRAAVSTRVLDSRRRVSAVSCHDTPTPQCRNACTHGRVTITDPNPARFRAND